jgi:glutaredoxin-like protein NrdH
MEIKLYSKPVCMQCMATKRELERKGMRFTEVDLTKDAAALAMVSGLGYMQAPVVMAGGDHWSGFRPDKISALAESELALVS